MGQSGNTASSIVVLSIMIYIYISNHSTKVINFLLITKRKFFQKNIERNQFIISKGYFGVTN